VRNVSDLFWICSCGKADCLGQAPFSPYIGNLFEDAVVNGEEQLAGADRARGLASREDLLRDGNLGIAAQVLGEGLHLILQRVVGAVVDGAPDQADGGHVAEGGNLEIVERQYLEHLFTSVSFSTVSRRRRPNLYVFDLHAKRYNYLRRITLSD